MNRQILALAIPSIISNISVPLVSTVDTMLMGHLSSSHLAALGIVSMIFLFLYGTMNFLRMGTAYGTLISQYAGVILGFILLLKYKQQLQLFKLSEILQHSELLRFLQVNREIFVRTLLLTFVFAFFYAQAAKDGEETLTVMILLLQFIVWFSYSMDGFANAAESLVGRYYGAKDWNNYNKVIRYLFYWGFGLTLLYMLVYGFLGNFILQLYTNQEEIIANTLPFMPYIILMPLLSFAAFIWDGIFIGMTATKAFRNTIIFSILFFLGLFYLTKGINFSYALWINFLLFFLFRGVIQSWLFWRFGRKLR